MIKTIKEWIRKITDYDRLDSELLETNDKLSRYINMYKAQVELAQEYLAQIDIQSEAIELDFTKKSFWNDNWQRNPVYYSAPERKEVKKYLEYYKSNRLKNIASTIVADYMGEEFSVEAVPLCVMQYIRDQKFKYKFDLKETWNTPAQTLDNKDTGSDCDDIGILTYFLIRQILRDNNCWEHNKHRLKCVDGHVYDRVWSRIMNYSGRHFYLVWLAEDCEWYTVETTYHLARAIQNYLKIPQRKHRMYGLINFTFNEEFTWSQNTITMTTKDYEKVEDGE